MDYEHSDSSGTDDDLSPPSRNRFHGAIENGRTTNGGSFNLPKMHNDMEPQIHELEQEAYFSVLRAFKAQSDAITWEQESLITELRKELRVSDEEHRVLLAKVNADEVIKRIREWRKTKRPQPFIDVASHKKQKSLPGSNLRPNKKPKSMDICGRKEGSLCDPLIGRKVWTRWPEDNSFYEAVISSYDPVKRLHALVYDINSTNETWEWVNLKEMGPQDLKWELEDQKFNPKSNSSLPKSMKGRETVKNHSRKGQSLPQNGSKKADGDIEIYHTDTLIKEIEKVMSSGHVDPAEVEKAKKVLRDHELALIDAISRLEGASDGESDNI